MSELALPRVAFKEWAAVVLALERGLQDVILRRGGISETGDAFSPEHERFLLFPTYFHQQDHALRPQHVHLLEEAYGAEPRAGELAIRSWAEVTGIARVESEAALDALEPRHVYRREVVLERLHGIHGKALYALDVRVHALTQPLSLPLLSEYGGCRSWVELAID